MSNLLRRLVSSSSTAVLARPSRNGSSSRSTRILRARAVHTRTKLPYPIEGGLGAFLSPEALQVIAGDWQSGLLSRLEDEVKGTELESSNLVDIIIKTASDRSQTLAFNYASEALNNTFFLNYLRPPHPTELDYEYSMTGPLKKAIQEDYKDISFLKDEVVATALGMFSSGWVWVAVSDQRRIVVIPTFGPGTLLVRSRQQRFDDVLLSTPPQNPDREPLTDLPPIQSIPPTRPSHPYGGSPSAPAASSPVSGMSSSPDLMHPSDSSQARYNSTLRPIPGTQKTNSYINNKTKNKDTLTYPEDKTRAQWHVIGETFTPLFSVSVHEHMWMAGGYGVWGKEEYLKQFWKVLDWQKVGETYNSFTRLRLSN